MPKRALRKGLAQQPGKKCSVLRRVSGFTVKKGSERVLRVLKSRRCYGR